MEPHVVAVATQIETSTLEQPEAIVAYTDFGSSEATDPSVRSWVTDADVQTHTEAVVGSIITTVALVIMTYISNTKEDSGMDHGEMDYVETGNATEDDISSADTAFSETSETESVEVNEQQMAITQAHLPVGTDQSSYNHNTARQRSLTTRPAHQKAQTEELRIDLTTLSGETTAELALRPKAKDEVEEAVKNGDLAALGELGALDHPQPLGVHNPNCAAHWAAHHGSKKVMEFLASKGVPLDHPNYFGQTPAYLAASNGHLEILEFLASKEVALDDSDNHGRCPIHRAASRGDLQSVEFLHSQGVPIDFPDESGYMPVHAAARNDHLDVVLFFTGEDGKAEEAEQEFLAEEGEAQQSPPPTPTHTSSTATPSLWVFAVFAFSFIKNAARGGIVFIIRGALNLISVNLSLTAGLSPAGVAMMMRYSSLRSKRATERKAKSIPEGKQRLGVRAEWPCSQTIGEMALEGYSVQSWWNSPLTQARLKSEPSEVWRGWCSASTALIEHVEKHEPASGLPGIMARSADGFREWRLAPGERWTETPLTQAVHELITNPVGESGAVVNVLDAEARQGKTTALALHIRSSHTPRTGFLVIDLALETSLHLTERDAEALAGAAQWGIESRHFNAVRIFFDHADDRARADEFQCFSTTLGRAIARSREELRDKGLWHRGGISALVCTRSMLGALQMQAVGMGNVQRVDHRLTGAVGEQGWPFSPYFTYPEEEWIMEEKLTAELTAVLKDMQQRESEAANRGEADHRGVHREGHHQAPAPGRAPPRGRPAQQDQTRRQADHVLQIEVGGKGFRVGFPGLSPDQVARVLEEGPDVPSYAATTIFRLPEEHGGVEDRTHGDRIDHGLFVVP